VPSPHLARPKTKLEMHNKTTLTKQKSNGPVTRAVIRTFASILIILSGIMLFSDKIFYFNLTNTHGFADSQTFVWVLTQSLSPLLIVLGALLRPYIISYLVPVYFYTIQLYWVFDPNLKLDDSLLHVYAGGVSILIAIVTILINKYFRKNLAVADMKITLLEEMLDLSMEINRKDRNA
jgi:hypothetical protein